MFSILLDRARGIVGLWGYTYQLKNPPSVSLCLSTSVKGTVITQQDLFPTRSLRDNSFTWKADGVAFKLSLADLVSLRLSFSDITRVGLSA